MIPGAQSLRRNSAWMMVSRALRTGVAALYFSFLARSLGVAGYGTFAGVCAMAGLLSPFASLGSGNLLIQAVSRDRNEFSARWGQCLLVTTISGTFCVGIALALARLLLPTSISLWLVFSVAVAELLFARLLDVSAMAFQAIEQLQMTAWFVFALTCCRLAAAAFLLVAYSHATARDWSGFYLLSTMLPAGAAVCIVSRRIGFPSLHRGRPFALLQGAYFSISQSAQTIYNDIDKTMLARISGVTATGIYGAAYRIVDAAFTPVSSVLAAAYARFFQHGALGLRPAVTYGRGILRHAVIYSVAAAAVVWVTAPLLPVIAGKEFADSVLAVRLLSPLILLRSVHCLAADSLTGSGYQRTRTAVQIVVALLNIGLNILVLPRYSWRGAVWTSLASDAALAIGLWILVGRLCNRETHALAPAPPSALEA